MVICSQICIVIYSQYTEKSRHACPDILKCGRKLKVVRSNNESPYIHVRRQAAGGCVRLRSFVENVVHERK